MEDEQKEERQPPAKDSTPADSYNPYAVDVPQETPPEPRRKLRTIEVVGGIILGLISAGIAFGVTCTGLTLVSIDLVRNLTDYGFLLVILTLTVSTAIAGFVFHRVFQAMTRDKRSAGKTQPDSSNNDS